jgi:DNA-binding MarR family transcriptional regulator
MARTPLTEADYFKAAELRRALRAFLRRSEVVARSHGLTPQRYQLLLQIKAAKGAATIGSLCRDLQLGQSNVTQQVRRVENEGLVRRELSKDDARVRYLRLTATGERRLARAVADLAEDRDRLTSVLAAHDS